MDERTTPEYTLEIFADRACVKDVVKGQSLERGSACSRVKY